MKEGHEFIGRRYSDTEKEDLQRTMKSWSVESLLPVDGELEKTEEEVLMLETINLLIQDELEELGIDKYEPVRLERVHVLPENVFKDKFSNSTAKAFFLSTSDAVYINRDAADSKARTFATILHELIHRASTQKFHLDEDNNGISDARVGYRIHSPWKQEMERQNRLRGFNELMTDFTVYKLLVKNQQKLESTLGITKEDIQGPIYVYMHYGPILEAIIKKISTEKKIPQGEVFENLERGQFAHNLLALKDIERAFGRGAIEILSLLETLNDADNNKKLENMIKEYFSEQNNEKRVSLGAEIKKFVKSAYTE